jgi:hypothetical protein
MKTAIEILGPGEATAFRGSKLWRRRLDSESEPKWYKAIERGGRGYKLKEVSPKRHARLEQKYKANDHKREVIRFPRVGVNDEYAELLAIPTIGEVKSKKSHWLVDGLILENSVNLLTAPPGMFKTWLSLALGGAVSQGTEFLGRKTVRTRVLYLDRENPPSVIRKRRKTLRLGSDFFHVWGHWWEHRPPTIDDPRLTKIAEMHHPFMIFDSFVRFHSADENSVKQMAKILRRLRRLADEGATILLLHHQAKSQGSQYRGSTDILAGVDAAFELHKEKSKHDTVLTLKCFKHRLLPEMAMTIRLNLQKHRFEVVDDPSSLNSRAVIERIKSVIGDNPRTTQKRLLQKSGLPETNGRKVLQQYDGTHWFSSRGTGSTLHYHLKKRSDS